MLRPFPAYQGQAPYIFVCYAHEDAAMVYPEITRLRDLGFNIWYDEGISPGLSWRDEVALALTQCRVFLYFVSPRSVASADCLKEVSFCLSRERTMLAVYLENTHLPAGLELSLGDVQAIMRQDYPADAYEQKLTEGLRLLMPATPVRQVMAPPPAPPGEKSIAILPLVNRSNDPENEYLCDGIAEELIGGLTGIPGLKVASQLSSFVFKNQNVDVRVMGERLGVDHLLSGSVQKSGNHVRIGFLLSQARDGTTLWSMRYDRQLGDILELQGQVSAEVADALKLRLTIDQRRQLRDMGTTDAGAYESYLLGLHAARSGTRRSLLQAVEHLQRAADLDPDFARVHWWLYFCYWRLIGVGEPRGEMEHKGDKALAQARATGFEPPVPWIKARRDLILASRPDQRTLAREACEKLLNQDPEWRLFQYVQMGECLISAGFNHGACAYYEHYLEYSTHDLSATWIQPRYRSLLTQVGRFDRAIEYMTELGMDGRAMLYARTGQYAKAEQLLAEHGKPEHFTFSRFCLLYWRQQIDEARRYYRDTPAKRIAPLEHYWTCFLLGEFDEGMDHLEEDIRRGATPAVFRSNIGEVLPPSRLAALESHPRYRAILGRLGIDDVWCQELLNMANTLSAVTGIRVRPDDDY